MLTIYTNNTISVGTTITGYYVVQEQHGTKVRAWHNNGYPLPRDFGQEIAMPRQRYTLSSVSGKAEFERDFLEIWNSKNI